MTEWTREWPTERGWYWFFGQADRLQWDMRPEYCAVQVYKDMKGNPVYVAGSRFLYKSEGARGLWTRMIAPNPPTDFQIEEAIT